MVDWKDVTPNILASGIIVTYDLEPHYPVLDFCGPDVASVLVKSQSRYTPLKVVPGCK